MNVYVVTMAYIDQDGSSEEGKDGERVLGVFSSLLLAKLLAENIVKHGLDWEDDDQGGAFVCFPPGKKRIQDIDLKWYAIEAFTVNQSYH